jgi:hypothetical protein
MATISMHGVWTVKPGFRSFGYGARVFMQTHLARIRELVEELEFFTLDEMPLDG